MKGLIIFTILLVTAGFGKLGSAFGQVTISPINILRYNDDFLQLKEDTLKRGWDRLKYIPVGKKTFLSFGGEIREQFQYFDNQNFGDVPPSVEKISVGQLWHRVMLHSNLEIGNKWRVFVQLNSTFRFFNPNPITPEIDENRLSLHQFFADYAISPKLMVRVGKQELGYGNNRLLTFREGPNTRLSFYAAILKYSNQRRKIDLLVLTPVVSKQFAVDDVSFKELVAGIYATEYFIPKKLLMDYYFLHFSSSSRMYNFLGGNENRQSFGLRFFSQNPRLNYELETTWQTGSFAGRRISAYGISADLNYNIVPKINAIAGVNANYFTGDKNAADNQLNTYNLLFSKPSYGLAAPIGSSNIININPYLRIQPVKKMALYAGIYFMRRQSNQDGTYSPGMAQVRPGRANLFTSSHYPIGTQYALETSYSFNRNFSVAVDAARFVAGRYVKETGNGLDITYLSAKLSFKF